MCGPGYDSDPTMRVVYLRRVDDEPIPTPEVYIGECGCPICRLVRLVKRLLRLRLPIL